MKQRPMRQLQDKIIMITQLVLSIYIYNTNSPLNSWLSILPAKWAEAMRTQHMQHAWDIADELRTRLHQVQEYQIQTNGMWLWMIDKELPAIHWEQIYKLWDEICDIIAEQIPNK